MQEIDKIDLETRKQVIDEYLRRCNVYAEAKIQHYSQALTHASHEERLMLYEKITRWSTYVTFNTYTLEKLPGTELDEWLLVPPEAAGSCGR